MCRHLKIGLAHRLAVEWLIAAVLAAGLALPAAGQPAAPDGSPAVGEPPVPEQAQSGTESSEPDASDSSGGVVRSLSGPLLEVPLLGDQPTSPTSPGPGLGPEAVSDEVVALYAPSLRGPVAPVLGEGSAVWIRTQRDLLVRGPYLGLSGLSCSSLRGGLHLRWDAVPGVDEYTIWVEHAGLSAESVPMVGVFETSSTSAVIHGWSITDAARYGYAVTVFSQPPGQDDAAQRASQVYCGALDTLAAPGGVSCSNESDSSVTLGWNAVAGADNYRVGGDGEPQVTGAGATSATVDGLKAGRPHRLWVQALVEGIPQKASEAVCATAGSDTRAASVQSLPAPQNLKCEAPGAIFTIKMKWDAVAGAAQYKFKLTNESMTVLVNELQTGTSRTVTGLSPVETFTVQVWAADSAGNYDETAVAEKTVGADATNSRCKIENLLPKPKNLACAKEYTSIAFSWDEQSEGDGYTATIAKRGATSLLAQKKLNSSSDTTWTFTGLTPGTVYDLTVRSWRYGEQQHFAEIGCGTPKIPKPGNLDCRIKVTTALTVTWDSVMGATRYRARIDGGAWQSVAANKTEHRFTGLKSGTTYKVEVAAGITAHWGDPGEKNGGCKTPDPLPVVAPPAPSDFDCVDESETTSSFGVSWTVAPRATAYQVKIGSGGWSTADSTTGHSFSNLDSGGEFAVEVQAGNSGGWSDSSSATCYTVPDEPVVSCVAGSASTSGFTASWAAVDGADGYQVRVGDDDEDWEAESSTSYAFSELAAGGEFEVDVQAQNGGLWSLSGEKTCHTLTVAPVVSCVAGSASTSGFTASWAAVDGADGYQVRVGDDDEDWEAESSTSYAFSDLDAGGSYEVDVQAGNDAGWSVSGEKTCQTLPDPPSNLACSAETTSSFTLGWDAPTGATKYRVNRVGGGWSSLGDVTSHKFSGLVAGGSFAVEVQAGNSGGWSASGTATCQTLVPLPDPPVPPSNLVCSSASTSGFTLGWDAPSGATAYQVRVGSGRWLTPDSSTSHGFSGLAAGGSFEVEVQAGNSGGWSPSSSATCYTLTVAPAVVCVAGSASVSGFTASWAAVGGADGYRVRVGDDDEDWVAVSGTSYAFSELASGGEFAVDVQAQNGGLWSSTGEKTCYTVPVAPVVSCSAASVSGFTASWVAVVGADGYQVRVGDDDEDWVAVSGTSHAFSELASGGEFAVDVQAQNGGLWSSTGEKTCFTLPVAPVVSCSAASVSGFTASWVAVVGADGYRVRVGDDDDDEDWEAVSGTSYEFSELAAGGEFAVDVQAQNGGLWSASGEKTCFTLPVAPVVSCVAGSASVSGFSVSWAAVDGAAKYRVRFDGGKWVTPDSSTGHAFTGLAADGTYSVEVQAGNDGGWGASGTVSCSTLPDAPVAPVVSCVAGSASVSGFSVSWAAVDGAAKYQVRLDGGSWLTPDSSTGHAFSDLSAGGSYSVEVQAGNGGGWSADGAATCFTLPVAPVVVCVAGSASVSGFSVSWDAVTGASRYQVRLDAGGWLTPGSSTGHAFTGLTAGGTYSVEVQAGNGGGWSAGGAATCQTLPDAPQNLECSNETASGFSVSWEAVEGADKYQARVGGDGAWEETTAAAVEFSDLDAGGSYSVEVQAGNDGGWGASGTVSCSTLPDAPVVSCVAGSASVSGFSVSWDAVTGATRYQIRLDGGGWLTPDSPTGHGYSGFSAGGSYSVEVQAGNGVGWSAGGTATCQTLPDAPVAVCVAGSATVSGFSVSWDSVDGADKFQVRFVGRGWLAAGALTGHGFSGLSAGGEFSVEVRAGNGAGWGAGGAVKCRTLPDAPVASCLARSATVSGFRVIWEIVRGATKHRVRLDGGDWLTPDWLGGHRFSGLGAGGEFAVEVQAGNDSGWGAGGTVTCQTVPDAPVVSCSAATASGFSVSWDAVDGADGYQVRIGDDDEDWEAESSTGYSFSDLEAGAEFSVEVRAGNSGGWGAGGAKTCHTLPDAPRDVECSDATSSGMALSWDSVGGASLYRVRSGAGSWSEVSGTNEVLSGLAANAEHLVEVQAGNDAGWGDSGSVLCWTRVAPPENVACSAKSSSALVHWVGAEGATAYRVRVGDRDWDETANTRLLVWGLAANTGYLIQVEAGNERGWSDTVSKTCWTRVASPGNAVCANESSSGFTVGWDPVEGATGYRVSPYGGTPVDTVETSLEISGLASNTRFVLTVRAVNERGSSSGLLTSCRTRVGAPHNAECAAASNTTTEVSWDPVSGADKYRVAQRPENPENAENPESAGDAGSEPDWAETAETSRTLDGLAEGNAYLIQAGNQNGWSDTATCTFTVGLPYCGFSFVNGVNIVWPKQSRIYHWTVKSPQLGINEDLGLGTSGYGVSSTVMQPNTGYTFSLHWWHTRTGDPVGTHTLTCTTQPAP